jgi:CRP/FNR family transcriptional regulator, cyclic AMP receptor protein
VSRDAVGERVVAALGAHPFTADLPTRLRELLGAMAQEESFAPGSWIMREDGPADRLHLVIDGRAAVEVTGPGRDATVISTVHGGQVIGWSWCMAPYRVHFDVVALDPVHTVALDAAALRAACDADHELGHHVMRRLVGVLAARLESTRHQLVDVYGADR